MKQIINEWPFYNSKFTLAEALDHLVKNKHTIVNVIPIEFTKSKAESAGMYSTSAMDKVSKAIIISTMPI